MDRFERLARAMVRNVITSDYPHLALPAVIYAKVESAKMLDKTFTVGDLVITNESTGTSFPAHIQKHWFEYKLKALDQFGNENTKYPPMPGIKSKIRLKTGAIAAVALPYGTLVPVIIGEVEI